MWWLIFLHNEGRREDMRVRGRGESKTGGGYEDQRVRG